MVVHAIIMLGEAPVQCTRPDMIAICDIFETRVVSVSRPMHWNTGHKSNSIMFCLKVLNKLQDHYQEAYIPSLDGLIKLDF